MATTSEIKVQEGNEVRNATPEELDQFAQDEIKAKERAQLDADRAKLKAETLAKIGLTAEEVAALLS